MGRTTAGMSYSNGRARFPSKLKVIHLRGLTQRRCCCKPNLHASALILCVWFIHPNSANSCRPGATRWLHSNSALSGGCPTAQGAFDGFEHDGWNEARVGIGASSDLVCHTRSRDLAVLN